LYTSIDDGVIGRNSKVKKESITIKARIIAILAGAFIAIIIPTVFIVSLDITSRNQYNNAMFHLRQLKELDYTSADYDFDDFVEAYRDIYRAFTRLRRFRDSEKQSAMLQERIAELERLERDYLDAKLLFQNGKYIEAANAFSELHIYRDSSELELTALYSNAGLLLEEGQYLAAASAFFELHTFRDSGEQALFALFSNATQLLSEGKFKEAETAFADYRLSGYRDSADLRDFARNMVLQTDYENAMRLFNDGDYIHAAVAFENLGDYRDSWHRYIESIRKLERILLIESNAHSIAAGHNHAILLTSEGIIITTGENSTGERNTADWTDIVSVTAGRTISAGLTANGNVFIAGRDTRLREAERWTSMVAISAGNDFIIGLTEGRTVRVVGDTRSGLGWYTYPNNDLRNAEEWSDITTIAAGWRHVVGLTSSGEVRIAGMGAREQLEELSYLMRLDSWTNSDIIAIAAGGGYQDIESPVNSDEYYITALLKRDGSVIVLGNIADKDKGLIMGGETAWTDIIAISVGSCHVVGLTSEGRVYTTGEGYYPELDSATNDSNLMNVGTWGQGNIRVMEIAAGTGMTFGLKSDGTIESVGFNAVGQRRFGN
jgi:TolA-binding protein